MDAKNRPYHSSCKEFLKHDVGDGKMEEYVSGLQTVFHFEIFHIPVNYRMLNLGVKYSTD